MEVKSDINGSVWKIEVGPGDDVAVDDVLVILESMKMEVPVTAPAAGRVRTVVVDEGADVIEDQVLVILDPR